MLIAKMYMLVIFAGKSTRMKKVVDQFTVVSNIPYNSTNYCITLKSSLPLEKIEAGQFTNVEIPGNKDVFLRRPFSLFEVDYKSNTVSILVKILGKGSKTLTEVQSGEELSLIYPLGKGFTLPSKGEKILAVGGGSGVAPVLHLARNSHLPTEKVHVILGARSASDHIPVDHYSEWATCHYTTDDGSLGIHGVVTSHPLFKDLTQFDRIYACGPLPMMKAVAAQAKLADVSCEVSLENLMACGFGVCLCCIEPTNKGNLCVCTEGPVFNVNNLKW
ncbi:NAD(P)H-flavin reductase [Bacteroidales bacterium 6E]|nr:NAD(P)H-flavin reductase [Bacteroidales bacterium 6E]